MTRFSHPVRPPPTRTRLDSVDCGARSSTRSRASRPRVLGAIGHKAVIALADALVRYPLLPVLMLILIALGVPHGRRRFAYVAGPALGGALVGPALASPLPPYELGVIAVFGVVWLWAVTGVATAVSSRAPWERGLPRARTVRSGPPATRRRRRGGRDPGCRDGQPGRRPPAGESACGVCGRRVPACCVPDRGTRSRGRVAPRSRTAYRLDGRRGRRPRRVQRRPPRAHGIWRRVSAACSTAPAGGGDA